MSISVLADRFRGRARHGWLFSRHSFSFADFYNPEQMGYRSLRVINEDVIDGGSGFPTHPHRDMEIISYVVEGELAHRDTTGADGVIRRGDVQAMSAGTGIRHSEFNGLADAKTRFLQIWVLPRAAGLAPAYRQASVPDAEKRNRLRLVVGPGALEINQDALVYVSLLEAGNSVRHALAAGRGAWIQVIDGSVTANGTRLEAGDGAAIEDVGEIVVEAAETAEFLLFDLA
jgi:redox-sensitive bicupin YhaK (pirin superfamily)